MTDPSPLRVFVIILVIGLLVSAFYMVEFGFNEVEILTSAEEIIQLQDIAGDLTWQVEDLTSATESMYSQMEILRWQLQELITAMENIDSRINNHDLLEAETRRAFNSHILNSIQNIQSVKEK